MLGAQIDYVLHMWCLAIAAFSSAKPRSQPVLPEFHVWSALVRYGGVGVAEALAVKSTHCSLMMLSRSANKSAANSIGLQSKCKLMAG